MKNRIGLMILSVVLVTLLCLPLVSAQPPFIQPTELGSGYEIKIPPFGILKQNQDFEFSFHVFNISDGVPITDISTTCQFHLYNNSGNHLFENNSIKYEIDHGSVNEWEVKVDGGNFSQLGSYSYIVQCNSTGLGGFESVEFEVTGTGQEFTQPKAILFLGLMALLIFLFIIIFKGIQMLPITDEFDEEGTLLSVNKLRYVRPVLYVVEWFLIVALMFIGSNMALAYMGTALLGDVLFVIFQIMFGLSLPMIVVWFVYILYSVFQDKKMKEYTERGWEF